MNRIRVVTVACCCVLFGLPGWATPQQPLEFESLLASAQEAQARSDFQAAAEFYRKAVSLRPEIPELQANLGLMYYQTGKDQQAMAAFRQAIHLKPNLFVPNLFLGLDYVKLKRFSEALPFLKKAALLNSSDVQAHLALGQAYRGVGNTRLAISSYAHAVQLAPGDANAWFHLGVSYLEQVESNARILFAQHRESVYLQALTAETFAQQGARIQAADAYKQVLSFRDPPSDMHAGYGFVLISQQDFPGAEREFNAELGSNPGSLIARLGLARIQAEQGATDKSARTIEEVWKSDVNFLQANAFLFNRGLAPLKRSELQHVLEERQTVNGMPAEVVSLFGNGTLDQKSADIAEASRVAAQGSVRATQALRGAAAAYAKGRYSECSNLLARELRMLPPIDLRRLAYCSYSSGDYRSALSAAQKMVGNVAIKAEGLYWETRSAEKLASKALTRASELDSGSPKMHVLLGDVYRQRSAFPDAEQEYRKALALQPEDTGALYGLSLVLLADFQMDEALQRARAALQKNPDDPDLNALMGEILSAQEDFSGAEPYLKKGLSTKPELVAHVHALLGRVYAKTDRIQQAIAELKLAFADDKDGRVHYQLARLYLKIGDQQSAKEAFEVSNRIRREGLTRASVALQQFVKDDESQ